MKVYLSHLRKAEISLMEDKTTIADMEIRHHLPLKPAKYDICSDLQGKFSSVVVIVLTTVNENTWEREIKQIEASDAPQPSFLLLKDQY